MYYEWTPNPLGGWDCWETEMEMIEVAYYDSTVAIPGNFVRTDRVLETISDQEYLRRQLAGEL